MKILCDGTEQTLAVAEQTIKEVRRAMRLDYYNGT